MLRDFLKNWSPRVEQPEGIRQSGALPYTIIDGRVAVLLITSRRTGKWIFPKGAVEPNMTAWDSAAKEALEEAGVVGTIETEPLGSYLAGSGSQTSMPVEIDLYPLRVTGQLDDWKEKGQRLRHWTTLREARRLLADPAMRRLAVLLETRLTRSIRAGSETA